MVDIGERCYDLETWTKGGPVSGKFEEASTIILPCALCTWKESYLLGSRGTLPSAINPIITIGALCVLVCGHTDVWCCWQFYWWSAHSRCLLLDIAPCLPLVHALRMGKSIPTPHSLLFLSITTLIDWRQMSWLRISSLISRSLDNYI